MQGEMLQPTLPWWRVPTVWLAIGGPALVVLASMVTLVLALHGGDMPVHESAATAPRVDTMTAATQARNHVVAAQR
jgi:hypothetical protein